MSKAEEGKAVEEDENGGDSSGEDKEEAKQLKEDVKPKMGISAVGMKRKPMSGIGGGLNSLKKQKAV